jgi:hypothetical protein
LDLLLDCSVVAVSPKKQQLLPWIKCRGLILLALFVPTIIIYNVIYYHGEKSFVPLFQSQLFKVQTSLLMSYLVFSLYSSEQIQEGDFQASKLHQSKFIERHGFSSTTSALIGHFFSYLSFVFYQSKGHQFVMTISLFFFIASKTLSFYSMHCL